MARSRATMSGCGRWTLVAVATLVVGALTVRVGGAILATQMSARVVDTQYGKLRGVRVTLSNRRLAPVDAFFGLQYASLLDGQLRFMPPTGTTEHWDGVRVALRYRPVCPQPPPPPSRHSNTRRHRRVDMTPFIKHQREDCLYLNAYIPAKGASLVTCVPAGSCNEEEEYFA